MRVLSFSSRIVALPAAPDGAPPGAVDATQTRAFLALITCTVLAHTALTGARVTISLAALGSGASAAFVGLAIGLFGLLPFLIAIPVGRWADRVGPKLPMRLGLAIELMGVLIATFGPHPWSLLVASTLIGTGLSMNTLTMQTVAGLLSTAETRPATFARIAIGASIASLVGPVLCGFLIDHLGYRAAFGAMSACVLAALIGQWQLGHRQPQLFPKPQPHPGREGHSLMDLLRDPELRPLLLLTTAVSVAWDTFQFVMPIHGKSIGLSASTIGLLMGAFAAALFAVRLMLGWLAGRFEPWQVLRAVFVISMLVYAALPFIHSVPLLFVAAFALGLALGASQPHFLALVHEAAPRGREAEAVGLRATFGNASSFALPTFFGAASGVLGIAGLFVVVALMLTAGSVAVHRRIAARAAE
jgi:predicted MFS family arabinose efflux permease